MEASAYQISTLTDLEPATCPDGAFALTVEPLTTALLLRSTLEILAAGSYRRWIISRDDHDVFRGEAVWGDGVCRQLVNTAPCESMDAAEELLLHALLEEAWV